MRVALALLPLLVGVAHAQEGHLRVVGGAPAPEGAWPDAAGIVFGGQYVGCTGTLVAPTVVLTAAHCTGQRISHVLLDNTNWLDDEGLLVPVDRVIAHPTADIAVVLLEEPAAIEPRAIAFGCAEELIVDDAPVAIVGYGLTNPNSQWNTQLTEGFTQIVDASCDNPWMGCDTRLPSGSELYAGGDGVDACSGDSGGPLYLLSDYGTFVIGVTSRGPEGCRDGAIWVRADAFVDWIQDRAGVTLREPTCSLPPEIEPVGLDAPSGGKGRGELVATDPDGDDLSYALYTAPEHGMVEIGADGALTYWADDDYVGADSFTVAVTDSGYPAHTVRVLVPVDVRERGFLGCHTAAAAPGGLAWLAALGLIGWRRRRG